jgi:PAS domain S-box-containing protein
VTADERKAGGSEQQPGAEPDRQVMPVDDEQPPRLPFPVVGVGASAGGLEAVGEFLAAMPPDAGLAFVLVQHLPPDGSSMLAELLGRRTAMPVRQIEDGVAVEPNRVYVIRPGHVLALRDGRLRLGPELGGPRHANRPVDDFFKSLAEEQRERAVCVVMSGMGSNGTAGAQAVKAVGGLCIAQDPESAQFPSMPRHLIAAGYADFVLRPADMPEALVAYARDPYARGGREADAGEVLRRDGQHLREILAVLRTRTRQDFSGYKKPTLLRRVQRRMGLTRAAGVGEYARLLRQSPTEVAALADDLLIHVTGFFRDPDAWAALREKVVVPLVAARESGGAIRGWVTACSSGEEAYSLAMLLIEEVEQSGKLLDVKVFATDLAERSLAHARAGVYPGGIESEIPPDRLKRFFAPEGEMYRVRADLRDRVVFAPQNVLQDPPFSRLDVASCRNLLIYLEPEVQQRVLRLLHFGLREGGALFLGTAETVAGADDLFEPIDKKVRIFRRVGPTRHGAVDFPLPHALHAGDEVPAAGAPRPRRAAGPPPSLGQLTQKALLEAHTPPAVTVDRDGRVVYYHGDTRPFLQQLSGEPTRDLLLLAREGVRGAVRAALQRAAGGGRAVVTDGWADLDGGRRVRVAVVASPIAPDPAADERAAPDYFVVSFEDRGELPAPSAVPEPGTETADELRRLRNELQSTIEELQTSNEELKASHEEVTSVNEELQSANEELETSKEEMQSLNEELTTVNAQLRAKMEEHQAASSDLSSLLTSTDIAVLFLDTGFRIRRYTPAFRDLVDLIAADVGRPLAALARKFDDPHLDADARAVLERLVPVEREVTATGGDRHYLRRVLPYRTTDNRIDGVVVTFVDITGRKTAERALAAEKEYAESIVETLHEPLLVLHPDLTVKGVNPAFYTHFRVDPADTVGRKVYHLGNGQWDIPALRTLLEDVLPKNSVFSDYTVVHEFEGIGRRVMLVNGRRLDHVQLILLGVRDVTELRRAEEVLRAGEQRQAYLLALSDALRHLADPAEVLSAAVRMLGEHLKASRVGYAKDLGDGERVAVTRNYTDGVPGIEGTYRYADYGPPMLAAMRAGRTVVRPNIPADPLIPDAEKAAHAALQLASTVNVPLVKGGELAAIMFAHQSAPRAWTPAEVALIEETAERTWAAVERAQAEASVRASEERLRLSLTAARTGIWTWDVDRDDHTRDANLNRLLGLDQGETTDPSEQFFARVHPDDRAAVRAAFAAAAARGGSFTLEFRVVLPGGSVRWLRDQGDVVRRDGGRRLAGACVDITDVKEAQDALRASEERYRALVESQAEMVAQFRPDGTLLFVNEAYARAFGTTPRELTGKSFWDLIPAEQHAGVKARMDGLTPAAPQAQIENVVIAAGGPRWTLWTNRALAFDAVGRMTVAQSAGVDITDRKRAEAALRESEQRYRAIAANLPSGAAFVISPDLRYQLADGEALRAAGFVPADFEGRTAAEAVGPGLAGEYEPYYRRALAGEPFRLEHASHGRHFITHGVPLRDAGGAVTAALAVSYDITDRVRAEEAVRAGEERLRLILASATDYAIFTLAPDRTVTDWSPGAAAVFGYTPGEAVGRSGDVIFTPEDRAAGAPAAEAETARREGRAADERWHVRKGGGRFFASGVLTPLGGGERGFVKVLRDLTDRKRTEDELRAARAQLEARVAERTAELASALDSLETEMARRTELARRLATAQEDERRRVARDLHDTVGQTLTGLSLAAAGGRAEQVRELSGVLARELHEVAVRLRPTVLDDVGLEAAVRVLAEEWSRRTRVAVEVQAVGLDGGRLPAEVETVLYRVVQEALTNVAKHAGATRVSVVVGTRDAEAVAVVEDDGVGFDPDAVANPAAGRPGGLGLAGMRERLALVGGAVEIESAPGHETTIIARIPLSARP